MKSCNVYFFTKAMKNQNFDINLFEVEIKKVKRVSYTRFSNYIVPEAFRNFQKLHF